MFNKKKLFLIFGMFFIFAMMLNFTSASFGFDNSNSFGFDEDAVLTTYNYSGNLTNLSEMQDVSISSPNNNQFLKFISATGKWTKYTFNLNDFWDYDYADLINEPTALSDFSDDLGDRGYTSVSNFTNDNDYYNSTDFDISDYLLSANWNATNTSYYLTSNPFGFYNSTDFSISDYALLSTLNNGTYNYDWNSTGLIINWSYLTNDVDLSNYFDKDEILGFNYYNSTDFNINDYPTLAEILAFNYYNSTDFNINDYALLSTLNNGSYLNVDYNSTGLIINWSYLTDDVDLSNYFDKDEILGFNYWNSTYYGGIGNFTAWDKDYNDLINTPSIPTAVSELENDNGYYNSTDFDINDYYLDSNPDGFIDWATASNGTLLTDYTETDPHWTGNQSLYSTTSDILGWSYYNSTDFDINDYLLISNWNATNTSYYLNSNPFGFYNSTDFNISNYVPYTGASGNVDLGLNNLNIGGKILGTDNIQTTGGSIRALSEVQFDPKFVVIASGEHNAGGYVNFQKSRGSIASKTDVQNGDALGTFIGRGYIDGAFENMAYFGFNVNDIDASGAGARIGFTSLDKSGTATLFGMNQIGLSVNKTQAENYALEVVGKGDFTDDLYVDGNVGIGTTTPSYPLEINGDNSGISLYTSGNISATGFITRTSLFDKSKNVWDYIKDADYYKDSKTEEINHSKYYGFVNNITSTDYSRPINESYEELVCVPSLTNKDSEECHYETKIKVTYPYTKQEQGVDLESEINLLRQGVYELKEENDLLKDELCKKDNTYSFCLGGVDPK